MIFFQVDKGPTAELNIHKKIIWKRSELAERWRIENIVRLRTLTESQSLDVIERMWRKQVRLNVVSRQQRSYTSVVSVAKEHLAAIHTILGDWSSSYMILTAFTGDRQIL